MPEKGTCLVKKSVKPRRPTVLTNRLRASMLANISSGMSVRKMCENRKFPTREMFYKWLREDDSFVNEYEIAVQSRADAIAEEILEIADDDSNDYKINELSEDDKLKIDQIKLARDKVKIDARKWIAAKMAPKKYGNNIKVDSDNKHDHSGSISVEITDYSNADVEED